MDIDTDYKTILDAINAFPHGASLNEIHQTLSNMAKRTLQRRVADLITKGKLQSTGEKQARRYFTTAFRETTLIPLSLDAKIIQSKVSADLSQRKKVNYQRSFLEDYQPNKTFYLSEVERAHLKNCGTPPKTTKTVKTFAKNILHDFLLDLSWNSSRLEGNRYSLLETDRLFNHRETALNKQLIDAQMLLNHKAAIEFLLEQEDNLQINSHTILNLHALLSENLLGNSASCGKIRNIPVGIHKTAYKPPAPSQLIHEMFDLILLKANAIKDPFEQSFFFTIHIPYLQAFEDVNKRVSRLCVNIPLFLKNLCPLSFVEVPAKSYLHGLLGVYELNRVELLKDVYLWAYERSCRRYSTMQQTIGQPNLIALKYYHQIGLIMHKIITTPMIQTSAIAYIEQGAAFVPEAERQPFIEVIDNQLMSLHEGNIARFNVNQEQYEIWKKNWH